MAEGFRCKQFFVAHDACAMKVGTDSLILGSWAKADNAQRILDIGTGTGLLTLMLMQKAPDLANATAIDIDEDAVKQAKENVRCSPWASRITVLHGDITCFPFEKKYDVIIANPPYFTGRGAPTSAYQHATEARLSARLDEGLSVMQLLQVVEQVLDHSGVFYCVYPASRDPELRLAASQHQLNLISRLSISATQDREPYLYGYELGRENRPTIFSSLTIRDQDHQYTQAYRQLCKDYYLRF